MATPPDDCAIEVTYIPGKELQLKRIASHGPSYDHVSFDDGTGCMKIAYDKKETHRFCISFRLQDEGTSGGFSGIKIWIDGKAEPKDYALPRRGDTKKIWDAQGVATFDLHTFFTADYDHGKATLLSIGNTFSGAGPTTTFHYALGVHQSKDRKGAITRKDPRILNNWRPGDGNGWL